MNKLYLIAAFIVFGSSIFANGCAWQALGEQDTLIMNILSYVQWIMCLLAVLISTIALAAAWMVVFSKRYHSYAEYCDKQAAKK